MHDFVIGKAFRSFSQEPTGQRSAGYTPENFSTSLYVATVVEKLPHRRSRKQESPAIADKPARRESLPKIAPIRRAYNVVADDTSLSSFV